MDLAWLHVGIKQPANEWARGEVGILVVLGPPVPAVLPIIAAFPINNEEVAVVVGTVVGVAVVEVLEMSLLLAIIVYPVSVGESVVVIGTLVMRASVEVLMGFEVVGADTVWVKEQFGWLSGVV